MWPCPPALGPLRLPRRPGDGARRLPWNRRPGPPWPRTPAPRRSTACRSRSPTATASGCTPRRRQDVPARASTWAPPPAAQPGEVGRSGRALPDLARADGRPGHPGGPDLHAAAAGFYDELAAYNEAHAAPRSTSSRAPTCPTRSTSSRGRSLYDADDRRRVPEEIVDLSDAVHGDLVRPPTPGGAGGTYDADVSRVAGRPGSSGSSGTRRRVRSDQRPGEGAVHARAGTSSPPTTPPPTERWIAKHMDEIAAARGEARRLGAGRDGQLADRRPARAPHEPLAPRGPVGGGRQPRAAHDAWPGGTFASFHAYPYYPDFQRYEHGLEEKVWNGEPDRYAGYLRS